MLISEFVFLKYVLNDALYELFKELKLKNPRLDRTDPDFNKFKREFINNSQKKFLKEHPTFKFVYIKRTLREIPLFFSRFLTNKKEGTSINPDFMSTRSVDEDSEIQFPGSEN